MELTPALVSVVCRDWTHLESLLCLVMEGKLEGKRREKDDRAKATIGRGHVGVGTGLGQETEVFIKTHTCNKINGTNFQNENIYTALTAQL